MNKSIYFQKETIERVKKEMSETGQTFNACVNRLILGGNINTITTKPTKHPETKKDAFKRPLKRSEMFRNMTAKK